MVLKPVRGKLTKNFPIQKVVTHNGRLLLLEVSFDSEPPSTCGTGRNNLIRLTPDNQQCILSPKDKTRGKGQCISSPDCLVKKPPSPMDVAPGWDGMDGMDLRMGWDIEHLAVLISWYSSN